MNFVNTIKENGLIFRYTYHSPYIHDHSLQSGINPSSRHTTVGLGVETGPISAFSAVFGLDIKQWLIGWAAYASSAIVIWCILWTVSQLWVLCFLLVI